MLAREVEVQCGLLPILLALDEIFKKKVNFVSGSVASLEMLPDMSLGFVIPYRPIETHPCVVMKSFAFKNLFLGHHGHGCGPWSINLPQVVSCKWPTKQVAQGLKSWFCFITTTAQATNTRSS